MKRWLVVTANLSVFGVIREAADRASARAEGHLLSEETSKDAVLQGIQADDGTRTHDLLHGKCWRAFARVRPGAPKPAVCSDLDEGE
jgi:hypothetical protein